MEWLNRKGPLTSAKNYSDCMLGVMQIQLSSPFGFNEEFAQDFASTTKSCDSTGYSYISPAPYAVRTNEPVAIDEPTCLDPFEVQAGDTCDSIAISQNISTFAIIKAGAFDPNCRNIKQGRSLCLPEPCDLYRLDYDDTCEGIVESHPGITATDLLSWNPNISILYRNLRFLVNTYICVGPPGGDSPRPTSITTSLPSPTEDPSTAVPKPSNGKDESNYPCSKWRTVEDGDDRQSLSIRENIELRDLLFLNPSLNEDCTNLLLDIAFCVGHVGDIKDYDGYPYYTPPAYTLTSATYSTTIMTLPIRQEYPTNIAALPLASGTLPDCKYYVEHVPVPPVKDQYEQLDVRPTTEMINSCIFHIGSWNIGLQDFLDWNPSLKSFDECHLQEGLRYCSLNSTSHQGKRPINLYRERHQRESAYLT